ncbi:tol-pal system protein YbgF [Pseudotabrizicola algicola]|uniref:Cell division coordinator CpoB n=1 Tax=Pseudotabrizicola algicola TaxID=2709381 RepID=A0A6B3RSV1_9RHOB|nr:tol-pal system protein YbgF [Pseudotabrizicola algicola]NEX47838.1 tol-pal system protein YbgF [Pseudotabrizicola algicola]
MLRGVLMAFVLMAGPAFAQANPQTLADIRAELGSLSAEFNRLKTELVQTGASGGAMAGGSALQRMDTLEAELSRLTARAEDIEMRLNRVISDGTNRIGDLEFRLCEVTPGCDLATVGTTPLLGGDMGAGAATGGTAAVVPSQPPNAVVIEEPSVPPVGGAIAGGAELAIGEQADFDRAQAVLGQGDFRTAADLFATFTQSYPGSPLGQEAQFRRGEALEQLGETSNAARAYLEAFSVNPDGAFAADALLRLGESLAVLGQTPEACVTLAEVGTRYPGSISATQAQLAMQGYQCQ